MNATEKTPLVTVVMPVYNAEAYLEEAIECILKQTYENLELLVINDGSTDNSKEIINVLKEKDRRIVHLENLKNRGVAYTRNVGLNKAKGTYLCWMDSDDTCSLQRIEKQVEFLNSNPEIGGVGTQIQRFNSSGTFQKTSLDGDSDFIKASLLFRPATVPNATVMLRTHLIEKFKLSYNNEFKIAEDYDFVSRCSKNFSFSILPGVLYNYRVAENSITQVYGSNSSSVFQFTKNIFEHLLVDLSISPSHEELLIHDLICNTVIIKNDRLFKTCTNWLQYIEKQNAQVAVYEPKQLKKVIKNQFSFCSKKAGAIGLRALAHYSLAIVKYGYGNGFSDWSKIAIRSLFKYDEFEFEWAKVFGKNK